MALRGTPALAGTLPRETSGARLGQGLQGGRDGRRRRAGRARSRCASSASDSLEFNLIGDVTDDNSKGPADKTLDINTTGTIGLLNAFNSQVAGPRYGVAVRQPLHHEQPVHQLLELRGSDQRPGDAEHQPRDALGRERHHGLEPHREPEPQADPRAPQVRRGVRPRHRRLAAADQPHLRPLRARPGQRGAAPERQPVRQQDGLDRRRLLVPGDRLPAELRDPVSVRDAGLRAGPHRPHRQPGLGQLGRVPAHRESPDGCDDPHRGRPLHRTTRRSSPFSARSSRMARCCSRSRRSKPKRTA